MHTSFYVIIYVNLGSSIQERISIGMMMASSEAGILLFSDLKIEWLKKMLHPNVISTIRLMQKTLSQTFDGFRSPVGFDLSRFEEWVTGLHRNSNNLIGMCMPISILMPATQDNFEELFRSEVDRFSLLSKSGSTASSSPKSDYTARRVLSSLKEKASEHLTFNYELTPDLLNKLLAPVTIPFAGQNQKIVTGHWIDFTSEKSPLLIVPQVNLLHETLAYDEGIDTYHFIISPQPSPEDTHYPLWNRMQEYEYIGIYTPECLDVIVDYVIENRLRPELNFGSLLR